MTKFDKWFQKHFKVPVPPEFAEFLEEYPKGAYCDNGAIWEAEEIIGRTEEMRLHEKGVCLLGNKDLSYFILRAKDGRVFLSDQTDYTNVDAWFRDITTATYLLEFKKVGVPPE